MRFARALWWCFLAIAVACGPGPRNQDDGCVGLCTSFGYQACNGDGSYAEPVACGDNEVCDPNAGCVVCVPDALYCDGDSVHRCNADGTGGTLVETCGADEACSNGACKTPCEAAEDNPSNVGCDFWSVDLDNEAFNMNGVSNDSAAQQYAIVVANNNDYPVNVVVTKNAARVGEPVNEQVVVTVTVPPGVAQRVDLPQREVDGAMGQNGTYRQNSGSGTFVSPHAYHVVTNGPVVVYQFNPIIQAYSNDASTLIPRQALGSDYIAVGFQTANPCGISQLPQQDSIPDHGALTIVGTEDNTTVTVETTHPLMASGGDSGFQIPMVPKNGTVTFNIGRYTVVNLETLQPVGTFQDCANAVNGGQNGDLTGTYVRSDKPVAVFTASERGLGLGGADNVQFPPDWNEAEDDLCCTDHLEEQLLPVTALGREFAISRSPVRSTYTSWVEPDLVRVVGSADNTVVRTSLPAPYDQFVINAREYKTFAATTGFTISADKAIQVAQYLVPQHMIKQGFTGDPSQVLFPAAEQHRKDYVFLVPATFQKNYAVFAKPVSASLVLDGQPLASMEFGCTTAPIGTVAGVEYEQVTCLLADGRHKVEGDKPFGLTVYGYYSVGSYAFVGGSDVKLINPIY